MVSYTTYIFLGMDEYGDIFYGINFASADYLGLCTSPVAKVILILIIIGSSNCSSFGIFSQLMWITISIWCIKILYAIEGRTKGLLADEGCVAI